MYDRDPRHYIPDVDQRRFRLIFLSRKTRGPMGQCQLESADARYENEVIWLKRDLATLVVVPEKEKADIRFPPHRDLTCKHYEKCR